MLRIEQPSHRCPKVERGLPVRVGLLARIRVDLLETGAHQELGLRGLSQRRQAGRPCVGLQRIEVDMGSEVLVTDPAEHVA